MQESFDTKSPYRCDFKQVEGLIYCGLLTGDKFKVSRLVSLNRLNQMFKRLRIQHGILL